jgi:DeoD family purine-nucleoside phosphorylase
MPIHVRAEPGDYAEACLLPGDPQRARLIAEKFLDDAVERNGERGLLGYTGTFEGKPVSVQATGMGGPSAAIVVEELVQLGVKRLVRVGTCGALQPQLGHGDLVLALSAVPDDGTSRRYAAGEPIAPTADWDLLHGVVHAAKEIGERIAHVGPVVSTDVFYEPDDGRFARWSARGVLAVEMEAAALFTVAALRGVQAACLLVVSDTFEGGHRRISDESLEPAVERMARIALAGVT